MKGHWVFNIKDTIYLSNLLDANAAQDWRPFKEPLAAGMFEGQPVIHSNAVAEGSFYFVADKTIAMTGFNISTDLSSQATLVMGDPAQDVGGATDPVRSLFQTDSIGLRVGISNLSWSIIEASGVWYVDGLVK